MTQSEYKKFMEKIDYETFENVFNKRYEGHDLSDLEDVFDDDYSVEIWDI